ncbi:MAG: glycolate oxidase subunit GlcF [Gammaproteobacteria bacterium]|nr:glycolate oxidase subunit GlcF [Gammaproteobacteria bacterium]
MQTHLTETVLDTEEGREADAILRKCVHCGFCLATCPTYQLLGDERDSPRGRIYLIKQVLEGETPTATTQLHLDRCLTCRSCETTCPSGVEYGRLADIGRQIVEEKVTRPLPGRLARRALRMLIPHRDRFAAALWLGQLVRPLMPAKLKRRVPAPSSAKPRPAAGHDRRMLLLEGCVQPSLAPNTNAAAARVLDRLGIELVSRDDTCCGAVSHHLSATREGLDYMRRNIDTWWPDIEAGAEAIVITASGCGAMIREYGHLLRHDPEYADKAARVSGLARDLGEVLAGEDLSPLTPARSKPRVAFHSPCSLQHGLKVRGVVERILTEAGFELTPVPDPHLCCGSAGTYSILQKDLANRLKANKIEALQQGGPAVIATANIGCQTHLQSGTDLPVKHWIELLDD